MRTNRSHAPAPTAKSLPASPVMASTHRKDSGPRKARVLTRISGGRRASHCHQGMRPHLDTRPARLDRVPEGAGRTAPETRNRLGQCWLPFN
jgi:hypothetical protein